MNTKYFTKQVGSDFLLGVRDIGVISDSPTRILKYKVTSEGVVSQTSGKVLKSSKSGTITLRCNGEQFYLCKRIVRDLIKSTKVKVSFDYEGAKTWKVGSKLHREDGPARVFRNGDREWWVKGVRHREDGPAIERADGYRAWFINGIQHRLEGPAIEFANGDRVWMKNGQYHRVNGPAVDKKGCVQYWVNGTFVPKAMVK